MTGTSSQSPATAPNTNTAVFEAFLRSYGRELLQRAQTAGLISHSTTSGGLKEFLTRSVLELVLPDACSIVSGQVFDGKGQSSRQNDVVIYDRRVPKLEVARGIGLYPVEGVVAAIEVKSRLDKGGIMSALDNSLALQLLQPIHCGTVQVATREGLRAPDTAEMRKLGLAQMSVASYVFSFDSCKLDVAAKHVNEWYINKGQPNRLGFPMLPRCIVGQNWIGVLDDGYVTVSRHDATTPQIGKCMAFLGTEDAFSIFLSHLIHQSSLRIRAQIGDTGGYFSTNLALPMERLLRDAQSKGKVVYIDWD